jgi:hypothetical protein
VFESVGVIANGGGGFWDSMNILMAATPIGKAGKIGGIIGKAAQTAKLSKVGGKLVGTALEHLYKRGTYKQLRRLTQGKKGAIQAHHILEARFLKRWGHNVGDGPAVILTEAEHHKITGRLFSVLHTHKTDQYTAQQVRQAYQQVYTELRRPELLQDIEHLFP